MLVDLFVAAAVAVSNDHDGYAEYDYCDGHGDYDDAGVYGYAYGDDGKYEDGHGRSQNVVVNVTSVTECLASEFAAVAAVVVLRGACVLWLVAPSAPRPILWPAGYARSNEQLCG